MKTMLRILMVAAVLGVPVARGVELYLAVGPGGQRMFSPDGEKWMGHAAWGEPKHDQNDLNVAVFFKGAAYAGGGFFSGRIAATRDGQNWSDGVIKGCAPIFGLEVMEDRLYAVSLRGQVFQTTDGETWTLVGAAEMPTKTHWIRETVTGNGVLVGSGDFGPVLTFDPKTGKIIVTQMAGQTEKNATWKRVAFGNGTFVVCGQDGLLAASSGGLEWENNETVPERGHVNCVVWAGDSFLATTEKAGTLVSKDGRVWKEHKVKSPKMMVRAGSWVYGWSWPPTKLSRSKDGEAWEEVPNEKEHHVKHVAVGGLVGTGEPPAPPAVE